MRIGILGAGMIGGTLCRLWRAAGHEVCVGTRHPEQLSALASETGATTGSAADAVRFGEVVLLAVPLAAMPAIASELGAQLVGKVVLDANNAYPARDGETATAASAHAGGSSAWVASILPGARVVKAFNTVYFKVLLERAHEGALGIPLAGDAAAALAVAKRLVEDAGFQPVVVGPLAAGARFEPGTDVYNTGVDADGLAQRLGVPR